MSRPRSSTGRPRSSTTTLTPAFAKAKAANKPAGPLKNKGVFIALILFGNLQVFATPLQIHRFL